MKQSITYVASITAAFSFLIAAKHAFPWLSWWLVTAPIWLPLVGIVLLSAFLFIAFWWCDIEAGDCER